MARIKSIVIQVEIDEAKKAHNCQANANHRINKGDRRLKVRNQRSWDHYCIPCAIKILDQDIAELETLRSNASAA